MAVKCVAALIVSPLFLGCVAPDTSVGYCAGAPLAEYTDGQLIARLGAARIGADEYEHEIRRELARRRAVAPLLEAFESAVDPLRRRGVLLALYEIDDSRITAAFRARLSDDTSEEACYIANYLAKGGDADALAILNRNYRCYPVSSLQWSHTVRLFGKHRYRPAAANLIYSLDAAVFNVSAAAYESLREIFPGEHPRHGTIAQARTYFARLTAGQTPDDEGRSSR